MLTRLILVGVPILLFLGGLTAAWVVTSRRRREARLVRAGKVRRTRHSLPEGH